MALIKGVKRWVAPQRKRKDIAAPNEGQTGEILAVFVSDCKRRCLALLYYDDDVSEIGQKRTLPQRSACMCVCVFVLSDSPPSLLLCCDRCSFALFSLCSSCWFAFSFLVTHLNIICMIWFSCNLSLSLSLSVGVAPNFNFFFFLVSKDQLSFVAALTSVALTSTLYFYSGVFILCCYSILTVDCLILLKYRNMHFITLNSF